MVIEQSRNLSIIASFILPPPHVSNLLKFAEFFLIDLIHSFFCFDYSILSDYNSLIFPIDFRTKKGDLAIHIAKQFGNVILSKCVEVQINRVEIRFNRSSSGVLQLGNIRVDILL